MINIRCSKINKISFVSDTAAAADRRSSSSSDFQSKWGAPREPNPSKSEPFQIMTKGSHSSSENHGESEYEV